MPNGVAISDEAVRSWRSAAQFLHPRRRRSPADLVHRLAGVQAQVRSAAGTALATRADGLTRERVDRARLRERSIVHTWAMRGTLHLIAAEDYAWMVPVVVAPQLSNAHRRLRQEGVTRDASADALRAIERMLERDGPLDRSEIAERLDGRGIRARGQALAHLLWLAAARGLICYGPDRGAAQRFILVRDWLSPSKVMQPEAALVELGARYLRAHAPARPADLAFWSGISLTDARRAWLGLAPRLREISTARGPRWSLRSSPSGGDPDGARGVVRLLPSFDEYLLGWRDRDVVVAPQDWREINRGGGWLHPAIVVDGRAVGTWTTTGASRGLRLEARPFSRLSSGARDGIAAEAAALASFLGTPIDVDVVRPDRAAPEHARDRPPPAKRR
jgi:Winged helix DNA-binding domain